MQVWFFPPIFTWIPGIELRSLGLHSKPLLRWAFSLAPFLVEFYSSPLFQLWFFFSPDLFLFSSPYLLQYKFGSIPIFLWNYISDTDHKHCTWKKITAKKKISKLLQENIEGTYPGLVPLELGHVNHNCKLKTFKATMEQGVFGFFQRSFQSAMKSSALECKNTVGKCGKQAIFLVYRIKAFKLFKACFF